MTFKIKDSLSVDGSVVIDQNKNITANDLTVNGTLTASGLQTALVSGTNIKTVNGTSLLGSGNLDTTPEFLSITSKPTTLSGYGITDAQLTLVSGTNIKTVNGTSLLGSGDVAITVPTAVSQLTNDSAYLTSSTVSASVIDDLSTTSTSKGWSANKLNTTLGDISSALAAIIGQ